MILNEENAEIVSVNPNTKTLNKLSRNNLIL